MIQANELRIGNTVLYKGEHVSININGILAIANGSDKYSPIPIQPEHLQRFGFKQKGLPYPMQHRDGYDIFLFHKSAIWIYFHNRKLHKVTSGSGCREHAYIKSVHQLQNLYFALTSQELKTTNDGK